MLISGRAGDGTCGVGDHSLFLAAELAREIEVDLLYRQGRKPREEYSRLLTGLDRLSLIPIRGFGSAHLGEILQLVRDRRPDILHLQYPAREYRFSLMPLWLAWLRRQLRPARFVLTLHEYSAAHPLRRLAARILMNRADLVLVPSLAEYRALKHGLPQFSLHHVPNGCFFARLADSRREYPGKRDAALLYFGLPSKTKSLHRLLEVVRAMRQALGHAALKLHFVGTLPAGSRAGLASLDSSRGGFIQFHPFLAVRELQQLAEKSILVLFPFPFDTHRSSLINALAWATPIACLGYADGIAEEYAGMLPMAPVREDQAFASALGDFVALQRADFASAAREQLDRQRALRARLDISRIADAHLTIYNQALAGRTSR